MCLIVFPLLFDYIYQRDTRFGRAKVVFIPATFEFAAGSTFVFVIVRIDVT